MTDQTVGLPALPARPGYLRALAARATLRGELRPARAWAVSVVLVALMAGHVWNDEGELPNILFTFAVTGALIAFVLVISSRALFATVVVATLVAAVATAAAAKRATINMVVHAYDLFFYLSSWSTISYLWSDQRR